MRVFVHRKHYETVVDALVKMANNVKLGAGMEKGTEMDYSYLRNNKSVC